VRTIAYIRVSTENQDAKSQRHEILEYAHSGKMSIDEFIEMSISSKKSTKIRKIDELLNHLNPGDRLIVSELSRLGRSVGEIIRLVDTLLKKEICFVAIKERIILNGRHDIQTKVMVTMFGLFAEIERDLISERTKQGLAAAKAKGKQLGRPKGTYHSKLDGKEDEIKKFLKKKVSKASIAKILDVSATTLHHFINSRNLS
jgi:DNA invertase Pin-like site-specific DNA recombinase